MRAAVIAAPRCVTPRHASATARTWRCSASVTGAASHGRAERACLVALPCCPRVEMPYRAALAGKQPVSPPGCRGVSSTCCARIAAASIMAAVVLVGSFVACTQYVINREGLREQAQASFDDAAASLARYMQSSLSSTFRQRNMLISALEAMGDAGESMGSGVGPWPPRCELASRSRHPPFPHVVQSASNSSETRRPPSSPPTL